MAPSLGKYVEPDEVVISDHRGQNGITMSAISLFQNPPTVLSKIDEVAWDVRGNPKETPTRYPLSARTT